MELHVLFYKDKYGSMTNATKHPDGLAVMAFFFKIADYTNSAYVELTQSLEKIKHINSNTTLNHPHALLDYVRISFGLV